MFARVTPYKMKPGSRDDTVAIMDGLKGRILALDGMKQFINVMDADGKGYVVALTANPDTTLEQQQKINALWAAFSDHLEAIPDAESYEVLADWDV